MLTSLKVRTCIDGLGRRAKRYGRKVGERRARVSLVIKTKRMDAAVNYWTGNE